MTSRQAMDFIRYRGVVLESARGFEPSLAERVVGKRIRGSWWGHSKGHQIYELANKVHDSRVVLVCTLAGGKITYIHRRLWPPFIRMAERFPPHALDQVRQIHLPSGRHRRQDISFPAWVPEPVMMAAKSLSAREATREIQVWLKRYGVD